jgi:hypothetical protein
MRGFGSVGTSGSPGFFSTAPPRDILGYKVTAGVGR